MRVALASLSHVRAGPTRSRVLWQAVEMRGRHWPYVAVLLLLTGCEEAAKKPPMEPPPDDTPRPPAGKPTDSKPAHEATRVTLDTNLEWSSADSSTSFGTDPTPDGADAGYLPRGPGCALRARSGAARHDRGCPPWDRRIRRLGAPWRWRRGQRKSWPARRLRRAGLPGSRRRRPSAATPPTPTGKPFPQGENVAAPTAADLFALSRVAGVHSVAVMVPKQVRTTPVIRSCPWSSACNAPFRPLTPRQRPPYPRTATAHLQVLPPPMTEHLRSDIEAAWLIADGRARA